MIDEPFEYLSFGGTFGRTFSIWLDRMDLFLTLAGIVMIPFSILTITVTIFVASLLIREEEVPDFHPTHIPLITMVFMIQTFVWALCAVLGRGAITKAVGLMYIGQRPSRGTCLKDAWDRKCALIGTAAIVYGSVFCAALIPWIFITLTIGHTNVLMITLTSLLSLAVLVGGLYGYIGVTLANPAIMVENFSNPLQGIQRSWELANGSRCYLLCTLCSMWFLSNLVSRLLHNMFLNGDIMDALFSIVGIIVTLMPMMIFFPLHAILETVMYLNLRIGRESMNHQVLSGDLMRDAPLGSRFRNDDPLASSGPSIGIIDSSTASLTHVDYRHVPLMDDEDHVPLNSGGAKNQMV